MKLDAKVHIHTPTYALSSDSVITVPIDEDYICDGDDIINDVEAYVFETYGVNLYVGQDITIENYDELCDDLFNK